MRFFYDNLIDYDGVVITPVSENVNLPAANVVNPLRKRVYRTGTSVAAEKITFDLLTAKAVTAVILLDHTLTAGDTLIKLEGSSNNFSSVAFTQTLTYAADTIVQAFSTQTYRYWRVSFTKSAAGQTRDIGRIFIGEYYETSEPPDYDGFGRTRIDPSKSQRSAGGQEYTDIREQFRELKTKFTDCPGTQIANFAAVFESRGMHTPFFIQIDPSLLPTIYYVKFSADFKRDVKAFDADFYWDTTLQFREQL